MFADMYLDYFQLKEAPFSLISDPRFLFLSEDHSKVRAYIEYAMQVSDSFLVCSGEIGTGKTTLVNDALSRSYQAKIARIQVNHATSREFLQQLALEFKLDSLMASKSESVRYQRVEILEKLKQFLIQQFRSGVSVFLIVDEAHNISADILEDIRYLSDIEVNNSKLLGVILVGQPELNELIDRPEMEHIAQRVRLRCHIKPLRPSDILNYVKHRLKVAGSRNNSIFSEDCVPVIYQFTGGRMRLINTLCDYALLHCYVEKKASVNGLVIQKAANELGWAAYETRYGENSDVTRFTLPAMEDRVNAKLIVKQNNHIIEEIKLTKDCIKIGRQSDNDIPVDDFKVSRYHAQIITQGNNSYLHDLNSTNGTTICGNAVSVHKLTSGESFVIGIFEFIFVQLVEAGLEKPAARDNTRQYTLDERDHTRIHYRPPYISLVNSEQD